jgi:hypothetical protein
MGFFFFFSLCDEMTERELLINMSEGEEEVNGAGSEDGSPVKQNAALPTVLVRCSSTRNCCFTL